jgi:hypothetical protein
MKSRCHWRDENRMTITRTIGVFLFSASQRKEKWFSLRPRRLERAQRVGGQNKDSVYAPLASGLYLPFSRMADKISCSCGSMANYWLFKT